MDPIVSALERPVTTQLLPRPAAWRRRLVGWTLMLVVALATGVLGAAKMGVDLPPPLNTPKISAWLDYAGMHAQQMYGSIVGQVKSYFHAHEEEHHEEQRKIVVTSPMVLDVVITQPYVCQIRSQRHIDVCALEEGFLEEILVKEGQAVKQGDLMFRIRPILYEAKRDSELAEKNLAQLERDYTKNLAEKKFPGGIGVVSKQEVALYEAKLKRAEANLAKAEAELKFTEIRARFDGIVDRLREREGSLIKEGDILTTLSDNSLMWVYFNVPERQYLEYIANREQHEKEDRIELLLANQVKFPEPGKISQKEGVGAIEAQFNNENGNIAFRADFKNPHRLLRHGQTGTILIHRTLKNARVIPQRATFEILDKRYVKIVGEDGVADQRLITIEHELEDIFVIDSKVDVKDKIGLDVNDKLVLDGVREVEVGSKVEYEFRKPEEALKNQKFHAE